MVEPTEGQPQARLRWVEVHKICDTSAMAIRLARA
jgi:hypothetical protein